MSTTLNVLHLIQSVVTEYITYPDYVPEDAADTALSYHNVAFPYGGRVLSGVKYGKSSTWRVEIVSTSTAILESLIDDLLTLDNTNNSDFQRVFAEVINIEAKEPLQKYRRAFVDLTVYNN